MAKITNYLIGIAKTAIKNDIVGTYTHYAWGDDNTTPTNSDTALTSEITRKTLESIDSSSKPDTIIFKGKLLFGEANSNTLVEIGVFDASSGGNILFHTLSLSKTKASDTQLFYSSNLKYSVINTV